MRYLGKPFFYGFDVKSENGGLISQHAVVNTPEGEAFWLSDNSLNRYNGRVTKVNTAIDDYIFGKTSEGRINSSQKKKVFAGLNPSFNEAIWFYPDAENTENNRYFIYNYKDNIAYDGTLVRTTWFPDGLFEKPYATGLNGENGVIYVHEVGYNDDGSAMESFIETGYFDIGDGENTFLVSKFIPDFKLTGDLLIEIRARDFPNEDSVTKGPFLIDENTKKKSLRVRGREMSIKYTSNQINGFFREGKLRINPVEDGKR